MDSHIFMCPDWVSACSPVDPQHEQG